MSRQKVLIFLDIDGVFSTENALKSAWQDYTGCATFEESSEYMKKHDIPWPHLSMFDWPFDKLCCNNYHLLQRTLYEMGLEPCTVISSSWRLGFDCGPNRGSKKKEIVNIGDIFVLKGLQVMNLCGRTDRFGERGLEILKFLEDNKIDYPYISIDDENPYDVEKHIGKDKCVNTKFKTGFQREHVDEAIDKLVEQMDKTNLVNYVGR